MLRDPRLAAAIFACSSPLIESRRSMNIPMRLAICLVLTFGWFGKVAAQAPDPKTPSPAKYPVREARGHKVAMRDGVKLSVDVYRPDIEGKHAAILIHTPYSNNSSGLVERARSFAKRG